jgi:opacity protein-like surface antigen
VARTGRRPFHFIGDPMNARLLVALVLPLCSAAASAQGYGIVAGGLSHLSGSCFNATRCDKSGPAAKLVGGYKFTPTWAAEVAYFHLGKAKTSSGALSGAIRNSALGGGIAYHADGPDSHFVARVGLAAVKTKVSGAVVGLGSATDSDTGVSLTGGLGAGFKVNKKLSIDAAWDVAKAAYEKRGFDASGNVNFFSIGATFWF